MIYSSHDCRSLTVVSAEAYNLQLMSLYGNSAQRLIRGISAAIINRYDLVGTFQSIQNWKQAGKQQRNIFFFIVDRDEYRQPHALGSSQSIGRISPAV